MVQLNALIPIIGEVIVVEPSSYLHHGGRNPNASNQLVSLSEKMVDESFSIGKLTPLTTTYCGLKGIRYNI